MSNVISNYVTACDYKVHYPNTVLNLIFCVWQGSVHVQDRHRVSWSVLGLGVGIEQGSGD